MARNLRKPKHKAATLVFPPKNQNFDCGISITYKVHVSDKTGKKTKPKTDPKTGKHVIMTVRFPLETSNDAAKIGTYWEQRGKDIRDKFGEITKRRYLEGKT